METKVFKYKTISLTHLLWVSPFMIFGVLFIVKWFWAYVFGSAFQPPSQLFSAFDYLHFGLGVFSLLLYLAFPFFVGYMYYLNNQMKLTVTETGLIFSQPKGFLATWLFNSGNYWYPGLIRFETITEITRGRWWNSNPLNLHTRAGKYPIQINWFENPQELTDLIFSRAQHAKINPQALRLPKPSYWRLVYALVFGVYLPLAFFPPQIIDGIKSTIWREEFTDSYVRAYSIDSDGTVWAVRDADMGGDALFVSMQGPDGSKVWNNPVLHCEKCYSLQIGHDQNGTPYILSENRDYATVYEWDGRTWQEWQIDGEFIGPPGVLKVGYDGALWGHTGTALLMVDFPSRSTRRFELPSDALAQGQEISKIEANHAGALAVFARKAQNRAVYLFRNGQWRAIAAPAAAKFVESICQNITGSLWAVLETGAPGSGAYELGNYNVSTRLWQYHALIHPVGLPMDDVTCGVVDEHERIWINGIYTIGESDFMGFTRVLKLGENRLDNVVEYTDANSNQAGNGLALSPDGRVWRRISVHFGWMDTSAETLPQPLPAWASWRESSLQGFLLRSLPLVGLPGLGLVLLAIWLAQKFFEGRSA